MYLHVIYNQENAQFYVSFKILIFNSILNVPVTYYLEETSRKFQCINK